MPVCRLKACLVRFEQEEGTGTKERNRADCRIRYRMGQMDTHALEVM